MSDSSVATGGSAGDDSGGRGGEAAARGGSGAGGGVGGSAGDDSASAGGRDPSTPPEDNRPPRPEWDPPVPLGDAGWEESDEPLCEPHQGSTQAFSVWADERGVAAFFATDCNGLAGPVDCLDAEGSALQLNDGSGWRWLYAGGTMVPNLSGLPGGPLVLTGALQGKSGIFFFEDGEPELSLELEDSSDTRVFGVNAELAYAISGQDVLEYRAGKWTTLETLDTRPMALWGDEEVLVVVGLDQTFFRRSTATGRLEPLPGALAGDYTSVWGFGADDLWAGNGVGQLVHYDGKSWEAVPTGSRDTTGSGITSLWGDDGVVFFTTFTEFGRADGDQVELLYQRDADAAASDPYFTPHSLWGRSKNEVFLSISDDRFEQYKCGSAFITWFDGDVFHQF